MTTDEKTQKQSNNKQPRTPIDFILKISVKKRSPGQFTCYIVTGMFQDATHNITNNLKNKSFYKSNFILPGCLAAALFLGPANLIIIGSI